MLMKSILHSEITYLCIKIFFSMFIQMFFLKFIAPLKGDVSISKVISISYYLLNLQGQETHGTIRKKPSKL